MQSQAGSQDSRVQLELVRQLIVMIHLNSAAAALGQTSFLLCLLADKVSDRLWLWFSFGLHVQGSVKQLLQPTQWLPSTGERVNAISFLFEQYFGCCFVTGPQPLTVCSDLLPGCRQLWFVHIKCMEWICPASFSSAEGTYLQLQHLTAASGAIVGLPNPPAFLLSDRHALPLQQERMFNTRSFPLSWQSWKVILKKYTVHGVYSPGVDLLLVFCISILTSLPSVAPRCQSRTQPWFPMFVKWLLIIFEDYAILFGNCQVLDLNRLQAKQMTLEKDLKIKEKLMGSHAVSSTCKCESTCNWYWIATINIKYDNVTRWLFLLNIITNGKKKVGWWGFFGGEGVYNSAVQRFN